MVSQQLIIELQEIILKEYGRRLDLKEIAELANTTVDYFNLLAQILHKENNNENDNDNGTNRKDIRE